MSCLSVKLTDASLILQGMGVLAAAIGLRQTWSAPATLRRDFGNCLYLRTPPARPSKSGGWSAEEGAGTRLARIDLSERHE